MCEIDIFYELSRFSYFINQFVYKHKKGMLYKNIDI